MKNSNLERWLIAAAICVLCYELNLPVILMCIGLIMVLKPKK